MAARRSSSVFLLRDSTANGSFVPCSRCRTTADDASSRIKSWLDSAPTDTRESWRNSRATPIVDALRRDSTAEGSRPCNSELEVSGSTGVISSSSVRSDSRRRRRQSQLRFRLNGVASSVSQDHRRITAGATDASLRLPNCPGSETTQRNEDSRRGSTPSPSRQSCSFLSSSGLLVSPAYSTSRTASPGSQPQPKSVGEDAAIH
mmetsp:Transcript_4112/g.12771  ORF Transcript_4112/g.12771 Transcript_4112/m.12771 type:complete len:204 (+) Transcript_4112:472-1083(+)